MDGRGSRARVAVVGVVATWALLAVVGAMGIASGEVGAHGEAVAESAGLTETEPRVPDDVVERASIDLDRYSNCASLMGCFDSYDWDWKRWLEEELAAGRDPFAFREAASDCVGFCFNATIDLVDEDNWRLARVVMIGKKGERTPALVERSSVLPSSRGPAARGKPVRFACFDRFRGEDGLRFESCSQMATLE